MGDSSASSSSGILAPLNVSAAAACYRRGPGASERMAVLPPGSKLREIDRVEINRFVERDGITYYVLEVFTKSQQDPAYAKPRTATPSRIVGLRHDNSDLQNDNNDVLIDVDLNATPAYELERRFSDFEVLRSTLSVCFENLHPGSCTYCDTFIDFLACSSVQPGLYTKLTTRAPQRKGILSKFINHAIRLSLTTSRDDTDDDGRDQESAPAHCDGWSLIPRVVESFLREPRFVCSEY